MVKKKVLFINQEMVPYVPTSEMATMGRNLPQKIQENGFEIRTFMPKWGNINERRGQLHEVIRLSGLNLIIDDTDHPLIIKVASIPVSRLQVYFIDNEDYFQRRRTMTEDESGEEWMRAVKSLPIMVNVRYSSPVVYWRQSKSSVGHRISSSVKVGWLVLCLCISRQHTTTIPPSPMLRW